MKTELPGKPPLTNKHRLGFRWRIVFVLFLLFVVTTACASASLPAQIDGDLAVGDQHIETIESKIFHTGYQLSSTYQSDGQWHPDSIIVWTPGIQQENPRKYIQASYNAGNNAENYRKISAWTQKVHTIDTDIIASLSHNQHLLRKAILPGIFTDGPVTTVLKVFGIIEKTKAELEVYTQDAEQYINNIYGSAMMMEGGF